MSKILKKLAQHKQEFQKPEYSTIVERIRINREKVLSTAIGVARTYGTDDELDLLPLSFLEDYYFVFEGSPVAFYCERRLQERSAEDMLMHVMQREKRMLCDTCKKLTPKCICNAFYEFYYILRQV